ncbi:MAG: hypothetical protein M0R35_07720, partial [Candidatus Omnitrophica bacterium]|nr:hypothetical protein [Candidatus Omnitrophota bacterium]
AWDKDAYFKAYQKSFKDGEYNIQETRNTVYGQTIRSYFSGGISFGPDSADGGINSRLKEGLILSKLGERGSAFSSKLWGKYYAFSASTDGRISIEEGLDISVAISEEAKKEHSSIAAAAVIQPIELYEQAFRGFKYKAKRVIGGGREAIAVELVNGNVLKISYKPFFGNRDHNPLFDAPILDQGVIFVESASVFYMIQPKLEMIATQADLDEFQNRIRPNRLEDFSSDQIGYDRQSKAWFLVDPGAVKGNEPVRGLAGVSNRRMQPFIENGEQAQRLEEVVSAIRAVDFSRNTQTRIRFAQDLRDYFWDVFQDADHPGLFFKMNHWYPGGEYADFQRDVAEMSAFCQIAESREVVIDGFKLVYLKGLAPFKVSTAGKSAGFVVQAAFLADSDPADLGMVKTVLSKQGVDASEIMQEDIGLVDIEGAAFPVLINLEKLFVRGSGQGRPQADVSGSLQRDGGARREDMSSVEQAITAFFPGKEELFYTLGAGDKAEDLTRQTMDFHSKSGAFSQMVPFEIASEFLEYKNPDPLVQAKEYNYGDLAFALVEILEGAHDAIATYDDDVYMAKMKMEKPAGYIGRVMVNVGIIEENGMKKLRFAVRDNGAGKLAAKTEDKKKNKQLYLGQQGEAGTVVANMIRYINGKYGWKEVARTWLDLSEGALTEAGIVIPLECLALKMNVSADRITEYYADAQKDGGAGRVAMEEIIRLYPEISAPLEKLLKAKAAGNISGVLNSYYDIADSEILKRKRRVLMDIEKELGLFEIHGNLVKDTRSQKGILFLGGKTVGKSTLSKLLVENFPGRFVLNGEDAVTLVATEKGLYAGPRNARVLRSVARTKEGGPAFVNLAATEEFVPVEETIHVVLKEGEGIQEKGLNAGEAIKSLLSWEAKEREERGVNRADEFYLPQEILEVLGKGPVRQIAVPKKGDRDYQKAARGIVSNLDFAQKDGGQIGGITLEWGNIWVYEQVRGQTKDSVARLAGIYSISLGYNAAKKILWVKPLKGRGANKGSGEYAANMDKELMEKLSGAASQVKDALKMPGLNSASSILEANFVVIDDRLVSMNNEGRFYFDHIGKNNSEALAQLLALSNSLIGNREATRYWQTYLRNNLPNVLVNPRRGQMSLRDFADGGAPLNEPVSASVKRGGIDFRGLPIVNKAIGAAFNPAGTYLPAIHIADLDKEWKQIEKMSMNGMIPATERINEFLSACRNQDKLDVYMDNVLVCIAEIMRNEEEEAKATEPELRNVLVMLETANPHE